MTANPETNAYNIKSLLPEAPHIGIDVSQAEFQSPRLNKPVHHWLIIKNDDGYYRFSLDGYPFTSRDNSNNPKLEVTLRSQDDMRWEIRYHEAQDAYTIADASYTPRYGWTINEDTGEINFSLLQEPTKDQLFKFEKLDI